MNRTPRSVRTVVGFALVLLVGSCGHSDPFLTTPPTDGDRPFSTGPSVRLTFDEGMDRFPAFTPDDRTMWYSFAPPERADGDRCLASMPARGGSRTEYCLPSIVDATRRDAFDQASPGPDDQLIYGRYESVIGALLVSSGSLDLASVTHPLAGRSLLSLPHNFGGIGFNHIGRIRWIANDHVIVVAENQSLIPHCTACAKRDTIVLGAGLLDGRITAESATFQLIEGTRDAADFAISASGDSLYFTRSDDLNEPTGRASSLYAVPLGGGVAQRLFSVAASDTFYSIARIGARYAVRSNRGILSVDLTSGSSTTLVGVNADAPAGFGMITASTDGCSLLVESRRLRDATFTTDLYRISTGSAGCVP